MRVREQKHWTLADLPWQTFDPSAVDPELVKVVKAAALVEFNADDYATYLANVFPDDRAFQTAARAWSVEETQHGAALGAWAERADPSFDFHAAFARYKEGYHIELNVNASVRGSQLGELIARCIVETGTSSYYTALSDQTTEPVLKALCRHIAADELRHYKLFHDYVQRYGADSNLGRFERLKIGLSRVHESEDDELAYAYFAANAAPCERYHRETYSSAYLVRAWSLYKPDHIERVVAMIFRACGFRLPTFWRQLAKKGAYALLQLKIRRAQKYVTAAMQPAT